MCNAAWPCAQAPVHGRLRHGQTVSEIIMVLVDLQVKEFQKPHYLANFVQSTFNALPADEYQGEGISCWCAL